MKGTLILVGLSFLVYVTISSCNSLAERRRVTAEAEEQSKLAKPILLKSGIDTPLSRNNFCYVLVKNEGSTGWVRVTYTKSTKQTDIKRQPDAEKWLRNTFTSEGSVGYDIKEKWNTTGVWIVYSQVTTAEEKWITFDLPGHSSWSGSDTISVTPVKHPPDDAVVK